MSCRLRCGDCGKTALAGVEDAGQRVLCRACGRWVPVPRIDEWPQSLDSEPSPNNDTTLDAEPLEAGTFDELIDPPQLMKAMRDIAAEKAGGVSKPAVLPRSANARADTTNRLMIAVVVIGLGLVLWAAASTFYRSAGVPSRWEQTAGPQLLSLKSEAETMVKDGRLADAHSLYQEIQRMVAGRTIENEQLRYEVHAARTAQDRIFLTLIDQANAPPPQLPLEPVIDFTPPPATQAAQIAYAPATQPAEPVAMVAPPVELPLTVVRPQDPPRLQRPPRPLVRPIAMPASDITDEEIGEAIKLGVDYLLRQFEDGRLRGSERAGAQAVGMNVLTVYALIQCGQAIQDERLNVRGPGMKRMLDKVRDAEITQYNTYIRGLRATALSVYNRPEDRAVIKSDVQWLLRNNEDGAYTYNETSRNPVRGRRAWDNSNSQYGLLGVWSAAEIGQEVPRNYWLDVQKHWVENQHDNGQWGYRTPTGGDMRLSMTVAGLASLFVAHDWLDPGQFGAAVGREPFSPALARGLAFLESGDNAVRVQGGYTLYGLERVGLASGFKYFGEHDWYRLLARQVLHLQGRDGSLGGSMQETCFSLLFLARGRHPILMNKLRYDGNWANRPRDVANLARFASRELERPLNWQVVPITRDWTDWMDSPILYFSGHKPVGFDEDQTANLRRYINAGGMLFTQADGGKADFSQSVVEMAKQVCTGMEFVNVPDDHVIYTINYQINPKPKLKYITNGSRILWLHAEEDISQHWQLRAEKTRRSIHELGVNLFIYAAGKRDFRNRLASPVIPEPPGAPRHRLRLARILYSGQWDPEPAATGRFSRWFRFQTGYGLDVRAVATSELDPQIYPIAHLTGAAITTFSEKETIAMKKYVEAGGVLMIDACGGAWQFDQSAAALLQRLTGDATMRIMDDRHSLLSGRIEGTRPLPRPLLRQYTEQKLGRSAGRLLWTELGQGKIVYSGMDITTGLLGTNTWGISGYRPEYALDLMLNAVIWAADGAPVEMEAASQ